MIAGKQIFRFYGQGAAQCIGGGSQILAHEQHHTELGNALQFLHRAHGDGSRGMRPDYDAGDNEGQDRPEAESLEQDDAKAAQIGDLEAQLETERSDWKTRENQQASEAAAASEPPVFMSGE